MKKNLLLATVTLSLSVMFSGLFAQDALVASLLSPNMPVDSIPKDLKFPDGILPYLKTALENSIGKQSSFDVQFKIVTLATKITNVPSQKYDFLSKVVMWEVNSSSQTANKITAVSPDARVLAINAISESSNSTWVPTMLAVIERDQDLKPRIMAAKSLPALGNNDLIVPKLLDLMKNKYGASRAKFSEEDTKRFNDDKVAQAVVETLGELGDPRAFPVILQLVMSPETHRDETVKAGWDAMKKIKW